MKRALFRCEASSTIGTGHVIRCLTLADTLAKAGWNCVFASSDETTRTVPAILTAQYEHIAPEQITTQTVVDLLIVDGYQFDAAYEQSLRHHVKKIFVIDDMTDRQHDCDLLMDQTHGREAQDYKSLVPPGCMIFTGAQYALLRPQFAQARDAALIARKTRAGKIERILILISGSDPDGVTLKALEAVTQLKTMPAVDVIIRRDAAIYAQADKIRAAHADKIRFLENVADMATLMTQADLCIGAGGTASWERCCLGLPTVLIEIADNQKFVAKNLAKAGAVKYLGPHEKLSSNTIAENIEWLMDHPHEVIAMSQKAASLCDGQGTRRIASILNSMLNISLRPLTKADSDILYQWQTEPDARRYSRNPAVPTPAEHENWMGSFLKKTGSFGYIILDGAEPAGFVRLDALSQDAGYEVSILVGRTFQGKSIALRALNLLIQNHPEKSLKAYIYPENTASLTLFRNAGFAQDGQNWYIKQQHQ